MLLQLLLIHQIFNIGNFPDGIKDKVVCLLVRWLDIIIFYINCLAFILVRDSHYFFDVMLMHDVEYVNCQPEKYQVIVTLTQARPYST